MQTKKPKWRNGMTEKKYIAMILAKIKGSKATKKKAQEELQKRVGQALEEGATLIDVIDQMGPPAKVAKEWNEKIPPEEQKIYGRRKKWNLAGGILGLVLVILVLCYHFVPRYYEIESGNVFVETEVEAQTKKVVSMLEEKDYEGLCNLADSDMQKVLNDKMIQTAKEEQVGSNWGAFLEFGQLYMSRMEYRGQVYAVTQITVKYENVGVIYSIAFDEKMQLTKLSMEKDE